jgi:hypothetical protein
MELIRYILSDEDRVMSVIAIIIIIGWAIEGIVKANRKNNESL